MRATVTKCDECKQEIPETQQRIVMLLGIVKQHGVSVDLKTKVIGTQPPLVRPVEDAIIQTELCSGGCAFAVFKRAIGTSREHEQQHSR